MKQSAKERAYKYLYDSIVSQKYTFGTPLIEQDISDVLGISRTPVREAFKQLEMVGLVQHNKAQGTFVTELAIQDLNEIFDLRECLELMALRQGIHKIKDEDILQIEKQIMELGPDTANEAYYGCDRKLHDMILIAAGNKRLLDIMYMLKAQIDRLRSIRASRLITSREEHLAIIEALKQRDLHLTELRMRVHMHNIKESLVEVCSRLRMEK